MSEITYDAEQDLGTIKVSVLGPPPEGANAAEGEPVIRQQIQFQHGPIGENGINGVQNEDILKLLAIRLRSLNSAFPCRENSIAITKIEEALLWLEHRTAVRVEQGVEGKNEAHVS
jgi:hypothetical protein